MITPIAQSTKEARRLLGAITDVAARSMDKQEYLWPLSMPPVISEEEIQIAQLDSDYEYQYRVGLGNAMASSSSLCPASIIILN